MPAARSRTWFGDGNIRTKDQSIGLRIGGRGETFRLGCAYGKDGKRDYAANRQNKEEEDLDICHIVAYRSLAGGGWRQTFFRYTRIGTDGSQWCWLHERRAFSRRA
jgi:hypothetical protein